MLEWQTGFVTMAMIFPGMEPYLEAPEVWQGFHGRFVVYLADWLQPLLQPRYIAAVEERVYVEGPTERAIIPDVWLRQHSRSAGNAATALAEPDSSVTVTVSALEIHERYVEILDRESGQKVVTVIEVLSPSNKWPGPGREAYLAKQKEVRASDAHLVEIDLLRTGHPTVVVPEWKARGQGDYHYLACVKRAIGLREICQLYLCRLQDRLPRVKVPLAGTDPDVLLDLQAVLAKTYDAGVYRERLRYRKPCRPPLTPEEQAWADQLIAASEKATVNGAPSDG